MKIDSSGVDACVCLDRWRKEIDANKNNQACVIKHLQPNHRLYKQTVSALHVKKSILAMYLVIFGIAWFIPFLLLQIPLTHSIRQRNKGLDWDIYGLNSFIDIANFLLYQSASVILPYFILSTIIIRHHWFTARYERTWLMTNVCVRQWHNNNIANNNGHNIKQRQIACPRPVVRDHWHLRRKLTPMTFSYHWSAKR